MAGCDAGNIRHAVETCDTSSARVARQQYGGDLYLDRFTDFLEACPHPVVFNGDIRTPEDIERAKTSFPESRE